MDAKKVTKLVNEPGNDVPQKPELVDFMVVRTGQFTIKYREYFTSKKPEISIARQNELEVVAVPSPENGNHGDALDQYYRKNPKRSLRCHRVPLDAGEDSPASLEFYYNSNVRVGKIILNVKENANENDLMAAIARCLAETRINFENAVTAYNSVKREFSKLQKELASVKEELRVARMKSQVNTNKKMFVAGMAAAKNQGKNGD